MKEPTMERAKENSGAEKEARAKPKGAAEPDKAEAKDKHQDDAKDQNHEDHDHAKMRMPELKAQAKARAKAATEKVTTEAEHAWQWSRGAVKKPKVGMGLAGVAVLGIGAVWGVTEAVVAGAAGWIVYKTLKRRSRRRSEKHGAEQHAEADGGHEVPSTLS